MIWRAVLLLVLVLAASVAATAYFGQEVLFALGLLATQAKVILQKISQIQLGQVWAWVKLHGQPFLQIELLKKWLSATWVPLLVGRGVFRRIGAFTAVYRARVTARFGRMWAWYMALPLVVRVMGGAILVLGTLGLSVTSIGLWLVLVSAKLPIWVIAGVNTLIVMTLKSLERTVFKTLAFLQLTWVWKGIKRLLPKALVERKRRFDYRMVRAIVRRRRLTVRQLRDRKSQLAFRASLGLAYLRPGLGTKDPE